MYGLPEDGGTCPGATTGLGGCVSIREGCKRATCYMDKVCNIYKGVANVLKDNTELLKGKSIPEMVATLTNTVNKFLEKKPQLPYFRLHYSGDFFSEDYAKAWKQVVETFPQVKFWVYTRTFSVVKYFADLENFTLFLSLDPVNCAEGYKIYEQFKDCKNIGLAWMGNTKPEGRRWVTCPETSGVIKNTDNAGACSKCRLCVDRYQSKVRNIQFLLH